MIVLTFRNFRCRIDYYWVIGRRPFTLSGQRHLDGWRNLLCPGTCSWERGLVATALKLKVKDGSTFLMVGEEGTDHEFELADCKTCFSTDGLCLDDSFSLHIVPFFVFFFVFVFW